jgi:hypothetical protein
MPLLPNGQTCLEKTGLQKRPLELGRNTYRNTDEYSCAHPNAQSDGDGKGKGTGCQGHTHSTPDCSKAVMSIDGTVFSTIDYSEFNTGTGGDCVDIGGRSGLSHSGRNALMSINNYSPLVEYGASYVLTNANVSDGQYVVNYEPATQIVCNIAV